MRNLSLARNSKRKAAANLSACELELHFEILHKICLKFILFPQAVRYALIK